MLQAIWNQVYVGSAKEDRQKIKYLVKVSCTVHEVVWECIIALKHTNNSQSIQRVTEWRNLIGSTGLSIVGDFMDTLGLDTTEACQEATNQLLDNDWYIYLKTKDIVENGKQVVCKPSYIRLYAH